MPYYINNRAEGCTNKWAAVTDSGRVIGCHETKQAAINQALAAALNDNESYEGDWKNKDKRK
jgi:hypothetical protein